MRYTRILQLCVCALLAGGCQNEIDYNMQDTAEKLVVNALMETDRNLHTVYVSVSSPQGLSRADDARVRCLVNGRPVATGQLVQKEDQSIYFSNSHGSAFTFHADFHEGETVRIEASLGTLEAAASVVVPPSVRILSAGFTKEKHRIVDWSWTDYTFTVQVEDRSGEADFYRMGLSSTGSQTFHFLSETGETLYPDQVTDYRREDLSFDIGRDPILNDGYAYEDDDSFLGALNPTNRMRVFSDRLFADRTATVRMSADTALFGPSDYSMGALPDEAGYDQLMSTNWEADPVAVIRLMSLSRGHYDYYKAINSGDYFDFEVNPLIEPVSVPSNVEGGLGFVGVASVSSFAVSLPRVTNRDLRWLYTDFFSGGE